jgi:hypothetical protein
VFTRLFRDNSRYRQHCMALNWHTYLPSTRAFCSSLRFSIYQLLYSASQAAPAFNNQSFITAFQQPIFATAISLDANAHAADITPNWPSWKETGEVMLFNITEAGQPNITVVGADDLLLERCAYVSIQSSLPCGLTCTNTDSGTHWVR